TRFNNDFLPKKKRAQLPNLEIRRRRTRHHFLYESRVVDDTPGPKYYSCLWLFYGFRFDPYEDDYKILVGRKSDHRDSIWLDERRRFDLPEAFNVNDSKCMIFVYSYKSRSWKVFLITLMICILMQLTT
ncbi:hypothetical protein V2J09_021741, partial [Rumex salicifolius]